MEHLQYPIGRFVPKSEYSDQDIHKLIIASVNYSLQYKQLLANLSEKDLAKTYREGSWTVKQLLHHVADIHLLNFLRIKKLLTEEDYVATVINMDAWAITTDATTAPVEDSLLMLEGISRRLTLLLKSLDPQAFERKYYHPVRQMHFNLKQALHMAIWHLAHHFAHMQLALELPPHPFSLEQYIPSESR